MQFDDPSTFLPIEGYDQAVIRWPRSKSPPFPFTPKKKIAIVGTAPSSVGLTPIGDPEWTVLACSPACAVSLPAMTSYKPPDAWYEVHRWGPNEGWITAHFREFLRNFPNPVFTNHRLTDWLCDSGQIPQAIRYPEAERVARHKRWFFKSSPAYMMADAIEAMPDEIGIYGIDMAATEEYGYQRATMHHFMWLAESLGIKVTLPPESDLQYGGPLYGLDETNPIFIKQLARKNEIKGRVAAAANTKIQAEREELYLSGAVENLEYEMHTFTGEPVE